MKLVKFMDKVYSTDIVILLVPNSLLKTIQKIPE